MFCILLGGKKNTLHKHLNVIITQTLPMTKQTITFFSLVLRVTFVVRQYVYLLDLEVHVNTKHCSLVIICFINTV